MVEAKIFHYLTSCLRIGYEPADEESFHPGCAIYISSRDLLLKLEAGTSFMVAPPGTPVFTSTYILRGEKAHTKYKTLADKLKTEPLSREVTEDFISWIYAVEKANNPPQELSDLLMKKD